MRLLPIGWIAFAALGQELPQAKIGALMEPSLERQRASVRTQAASPAGNFFVLPAFFLSPPQSLGSATLVADAGCAALTEAELQPLAAEATQAEGLKPEWLLALVAEKSQGRPCALSPAGGVGLMQLAPSTVDRLHLADPFDPRQNLGGGARLLTQWMALYHGDFERARAAYDGTAGPNPQASGAVPLPAAPPALGATQKQPSRADKNH